MGIEKDYKGGTGAFYEVDPDISQDKEELCRAVFRVGPAALGETRLQAFKEGLKDGIALRNGDLPGMFVQYGDSDACYARTEAVAATAFWQYFTALGGGGTLPVEEAEEDGVYVTRVGGRLTVKGKCPMASDLKYARDAAMEVAEGYARLD